MLERIRHQIDNLNNRPQAVLCSLILLLTATLGSALYLNHSQRTQLSHTERYGQALAEVSARQAADALLRQDLISLQVILRELNRQPLVAGATVHDVENRLLVQSGHNPDRSERRDYLSYSANITLHNNLAGYLGITLQAPRHGAEQWGFLALWLGLILGAIGLLWGAPHLRSRSLRAPLAKLPEPEPEPSAPQPCAAVRLSLYLRNLGPLYNQLNSTSFGTTLQQFELLLRPVLTLYSGTRQLLWGDVLVVDFVGHSQADCSFRALCCAELLRHLQARSGGPRLHLAASIQALPNPEAPASLEAEFCAQYSERRQPEPGQIVLAATLLDATLSQQVELAPGTGILLGLKPPYAAMLERQREQLSHATNLQ